MAHVVSKYVTVFEVCSLTLMQAYCTVGEVQASILINEIGRPVSVSRA